MSNDVDCCHEFYYLNRINLHELCYECKLCGYKAIFNMFESAEFIEKYSGCTVNDVYYCFPNDKSVNDIASFHMEVEQNGWYKFDFDGKIVTCFSSDNCFPNPLKSFYRIMLTEAEKKDLYECLSAVTFSCLKSKHTDDELMMDDYIPVNIFACQFNDGTKYKYIYDDFNHCDGTMSVYRFLLKLCNINSINFDTSEYLWEGGTYKYDCPECGKAVDETDKYCPNCGVEFLPAKEKILSQRKESLYSDDTKYFCDNCSSSCLYVHYFCGGCGKPLKWRYNQDDKTSVLMDGCEKNNIIKLEDANDNVLKNKYKITDCINSGVSSKVYKSVNLETNDILTVKAIDITKIANSHLEHLKQNTELQKNINHKGVPVIVDDFFENNNYYIVSEYVDGEDLKTLFSKKGGTLDVHIVMEIAKQLTEILNDIHSLNPSVIHFDIKPSNIIYEKSGKIKLIDFGISKKASLTEEFDGCVMLSPGYAAPEQYILEAQSDARTDIFGLGMTLHHLVTGINPSEPPYITKPICEIDPNLPKGLEYIISKCTENDPKNRYQTCSELMEDLNNYMSLPKPKGILGILFKKKK